MEILSLAELNRGEVVTLVEDMLRGGGVAGVPTDTVYGLVCDAANEGAIRRMVAIKKRPEEKTFSIFVKDIAAARRFAYISDAKARFLEKLWPGPAIVVFQHKEKLPAALTGYKNTLGIRVPNHPLLADLLSRLDAPLAQTSANISGQPSAKTAAEVKTYFGNAAEKPDLIVDGGVLTGVASTVIDFAGAEPIIVRAGPIGKGELEILRRAGE